MTYASIVGTINQLQEYRQAAVLGSEPYVRLVEQERALRSDLEQTPEQQKMRAAWCWLKRRRGRDRSGQQVLRFALPVPRNDGPRCA